MSVFRSVFWQKYEKPFAITGAAISVVSPAITAIFSFVPSITSNIEKITGIPEKEFSGILSLTLLSLCICGSVAIYQFLKRGDGRGRLIDAYRGAIKHVNPSMAGGRVIDLMIDPPHLEASGEGLSRNSQIQTLAGAYGLDPVAFAKEVADRRHALDEAGKPNSTHLILKRPPWAERHSGTDWRDVGVQTTELKGYACDYSMIQALTSKNFARDEEDVWADVARVSGNSILVCAEEKCLILHRRSAETAYGGHLHMVGGNYEPAYDLLSLANTALRETREEIGLLANPEQSPCLYMHETGTNWHMAVFLGVGVTSQQILDMKKGLEGPKKTWVYNSWEGEPEIVPFSDLEEKLKTAYIVPTCYQAVVAWLLAGAPVNGRPGAMDPARAAEMAGRLASHQPRFRREGALKT